MKKSYFFCFIILLALSFSTFKTIAQCSYVPVTLEQRISTAKYIVLGKVIDKHTYIDNSSGDVNTLNKIEIKAWLKNYSTIENVYVITFGGVYGNAATEVNPSLQLDQQHDYILMLEGDNRKIDDKNFRTQNPQSLQLLTYADAQGCLVNNNNVYRDLFDKTPKSEETILNELRSITHESARKPTGENFTARSTISPTANRTMAITGFSPGNTKGGTVVPGDYITITGSGFGASAGTVFFSYADDGGATFTSSGLSSDIVSWSNTSITVKVPSTAGTGPINVNGAMTSASSLNIDYGHLSISSSFSGFGSSTRQRYYHRNMNGTGGYTFVYNTTSNFATTPAAITAFETALSSWKNSTLINWQASGTTSNGIANDDVNVVMFDATLPVGVLGQATSRFTGSSSGGCTGTNTVWCVEEIDVRFAPDPPASGFTWEYGPSTPSFTEYDFESVAVHELGHAHGLGHVINPGAIMHFAISNGSYNRTPSANDISAGSARVNYSTTSTCFDPSGCGTGAMIAYSGVLPLELLSFNGERISGSSNKLSWTTATERNTKGFYIQRSKDATDFKEIGFVKGAGNSNSQIYYSMNDNSAGPYAWYYRMRMVDIDGQQTFSSTIFIEGERGNQWKIWADEKGDKVYLYYNSTARSLASLKIYSGNGQLVIAKNLGAGSNEIDASNLSRGIYHYKLLHDGKVVSGKLLLGKR